MDEDEDKLPTPEQEIEKAGLVFKVAMESIAEKHNRSWEAIEDCYRAIRLVIKRDEEAELGALAIKTRYAEAEALFAYVKRLFAGERKNFSTKVGEIDEPVIDIVISRVKEELGASEATYEYEHIYVRFDERD